MKQLSIGVQLRWKEFFRREGIPLDPCDSRIHAWKRILALDLATVTGAAWDQDAAIPALEIVNFRVLAGVPARKQSASHGLILDEALHWIDAKIAEVSPDVVFVEEGFARGDRHMEFE